MKLTKFLRLFSVCLLTCTGSTEAVTLAWNASLSPSIAHYKLYGAQSSPITLGPVITTTFVASPGKTYHLTVSAVDFFGIESGMSNEVIYTEPIPRPVVNYSYPVVSWDYDARLCDTLEWSEDLVTWTAISPAYYTITPEGRVKIKVDTTRPARIFRVNRTVCP